MSAGPEARQEYGHNNVQEDGITARLPGPAGTEQRVEPSPRTTDEGDGGGALPAPSGIICLCVIAGRHQCSADPVQLTRALGLNVASPVTDTQILLAARSWGSRLNAPPRVGRRCRAALSRSSRSSRPVSLSSC